MNDMKKLEVRKKTFEKSARVKIYLSNNATIK